MDGNNGIFIIAGDLCITPYEIKSLLDVKIEQKMNEHATLYFKGVLPEDVKETYAMTSSIGTPIVLTAMDNLRREHTLFQGLVNNLEIQVTQGVYHIEVQAISYSSLLDITRKSRSFQDKRMPYADLIRQVTMDYPDVAVIDVATTSNRTGKFIVQHLETDWAFLKRMASHFNTGLVPDVRVAGVKYYFGVPEISTLTMNNINYAIKKDIHRYKELSQNGVAGLHEEDFIYYEIETRSVVNIGDRVIFNNRTMFVNTIKSHANNGVFTSQCLLSSRKAFSLRLREHTEAVGTSFAGRVIDIVNDRVRVHLDIDPEQDVSTAYLLPYSTLYSSASGAGWYCMPDKGDRVRVYFPDGDDDHAYAISSVHEAVNNSADTGLIASEGAEPSGISALTDNYSGMRDDPNVRSLSANGKEIRLTPDGIYIIAQDSVIVLSDEDGIVLMSENDISFKSSKNIYMGAEENIQLIAGKSVVMSRGDSSSITLDENIEVRGQEVKLN